MKIKRVITGFILSCLIGCVFYDAGFLYAEKEILISDFESPLDVKLWSLSIPGQPGEKPEQAGMEHETKITAHGKGAMKFNMVFKSDGHERMNFEKSVDLPVKDASKDGIEFFINPDELDKQNYDLKLFIVDNNGEVWVHGTVFASLAKGWNQIKIGFNEFRFAWGGDGDDGNDGLIDGDKIGLIFFMFSDEPVINTGKDRPVTAVFYIDEIKYLQDLAGVADKQPAAEKPSKKEPGKETVRAVNLPELGYFESREDIDRWAAGDGVKMELSGEHVTQGDSSVRLTFPVPSPPEKQTRIISLKYPAYSSMDWSDYGMLTMDFFNPNDFTVRLLLEIPGLAALHFEMPPSRQWTLRGSLLTPIDFLNAEDSYPIDNAKELILSTNFFTPNPADSPDITPKGDSVTVFIDNVRLLSKKETTDFIEKICPIEPKKKVSTGPVREFPSMSEDEVSRFRNLNIFWMDKNNITDEAAKEEFAKEFATAMVITRYGLNFSVGKPESLNELKRYDIIIFDDIDSTVFTQEQLEMVEQYYQEGGAVVMLGGWASFGGHGTPSGHNKNDGYKNTPIEDILPVELLPPPDDCSGGMELEVRNPGHAAMKNIPWEDMPVKWYNVVVPKDEAEVLAIDSNVEGKVTPIIVAGERSLIFTSVDCRGGSAMLNWKPWERFVIQGLNYITKDKTITKKTDGRTFDARKEKAAVSPQAPKVYPEFVPLYERDFIFMPSSHSSWADEVIMSPLFEELGFLKLGYGPVMMWYPESSFTRVNYGGYGIDLKSTCVPQFKHFAERHMPFFVGTFSGWEAGQPLDIRLERSRKVTQWANEIGGKYFLGVRWGESDGIAYYFKTVQEKTNRIERANAYIKLVKELREKTGVPPGKLLITYPSIFFNYGMDFEAGVDVINRVTPGQWNNLEINFAQLRGASRSFNGTRYGMGTATDPACHTPSYYDKKSGRYDGIKKMDYSWRWSQEDIFKFWIHNYYNGGSYLDSYYQPPLADGKPTEYTKTMLKFLDFVDSNPRTKDIVTKIAIVRSKGDLWGGAHGIKLEDNPHGQKAQGFGNWVPDGIPFKEESDFNYLNIFFPNFSDDCIYTKSLWTGTPYGAIDIIYPAMKLEDMEQYDCIIFLGFHRMDSVRNDFLDDIARYVENGGIAVLSADQLKDSRDRFNTEKTEKLLGLNISDSRVVLKSPVRVKDAAVLGLDMRTYDINSAIRLKDEKEPWVYKVNVNGARVISEDSQNTPLLLMNGYGKGYIFLFTSPTLSIIPPVGRSGLVRDVMDKASRYKGLPVNISPANDNVEFLLSKTGNDKATVFLMNHGPQDWNGDVIIDLSRVGLGKNIWNEIVAKVSQGYNNTEDIKPRIEKTENRLNIKGLSIKGDTADSYAFRQANFALIKLE